MKLFRPLLASAAVVMAAAYVPPHMELPAGWTDVAAATLIPLEFRSKAAAALEGDNAPIVSETACMSTADVISKHSGEHGCIAFAIRRPAVADLAAREDKPLEGFGLFGVVKEVGVDDEGLSEFQTEFFPHPLYRDEEVSFYKALGSRKLSLTTWNPIKLWRGMREVYNRLKVKKISGNLKGEGLIQGGIIIFDKHGNARYAYREATGSEVPIDDIISAVKMVRGDS
ncbi:hypothetical protein ACHAWU_000131 [Discostella pseudostelligera]|uniref:Peroxiredoxin-like 2A n=1 Tax=Discostella pseudostelligera TaxID=259834 RepID=A0ABD3MCB1_9STRA